MSKRYIIQLCKTQSKIDVNSNLGKIHETSAAGNPGEIFDTTRKFNRPFHFYLGKGEVIQAWDEGYVLKIPLIETQKLLFS